MTEGEKDESKESDDQREDQKKRKYDTASMQSIPTYDQRHAFTLEPSIDEPAGMEASPNHGAHPRWTQRKKEPARTQPDQGAACTSLHLGSSGHG